METKKTFLILLVLIMLAFTLGCVEIFGCNKDNDCGYREACMSPPHGKCEEIPKYQECIKHTDCGEGMLCDGQDCFEWKFNNPSCSTHFDCIGNFNFENQCTFYCGYKEKKGISYTCDNNVCNCECKG